ncbi:uncharacterized protein LOC110862689 isoform X2 [Folsomia candida]|uniref:uncharacterized protein LOC110862689 isoform X2 n=1 Tax=Folsomia candida TaxID=158441 RepID=UPI000B8F39FA|nr:uncharacterized protein LOC110862689 isoform X2 [Folsomia candida]
MSQNLEYDTFYDNTLTLSKTLQDSLTKLLAHGKTPPKFKSIAAEKTALLTKEVAIFSADISNFKENPGSLKSTQLLTTAFNVLEDLDVDAYSPYESKARRPDMRRNLLRILQVIGCFTAAGGMLAVGIKSDLDLTMLHLILPITAEKVSGQIRNLRADPLYLESRKR